MARQHFHLRLATRHHSTGDKKKISHISSFFITTYHTDRENIFIKQNNSLILLIFPISSTFPVSADGNMNTAVNLFFPQMHARFLRNPEALSRDFICSVKKKSASLSVSTYHQIIPLLWLLIQEAISWRNQQGYCWLSQRNPQPWYSDILAHPYLRYEHIIHTETWAWEHVAHMPQKQQDTH